MNGFKAMKSNLRRHKLPLPVIPAHLQGRVVPLREWAWGTRPEDINLYNVEAWVEEAVQNAPGDYFMLGQDGHGVGAWFLHCYLTLGPLSIFIQTPWGGAYTEMKAAVDAVQRRFVVLERLLGAADEAVRLGVELPGRLLVQQSAISGPRWAWVLPGRPVEWHEEFANAMTPALESLQHHLTSARLPR